MVALKHADDLQWLVERTAHDAGDGLPRITLYMPTHRAGQEIRQDFIRYRNLLSRAQERLVQAGVRRPLARDYLEPASLLGQDGDFWRHRDSGMAMFIEGSVLGKRRRPSTAIRHWDLPYSVEEQLHVGEHFLLRPFLSRFTTSGTSRATDRRFFVLVLSQGDIRLSVAVEDHLAPIEIPAVVHNLRELREFIDAEKSLQFHTGTGETMHAGGGGRRAVFHGHGTDDTRQNKRMTELFNLLNDGLRHALAGQTIPLIPVGVEWVVRLFREVNTYPHVTEQHIHGSTRHRNDHELFEEARIIADDWYEQRINAALDRYSQERDTPGATADIERVVSMAMMGQVHALLVDLDSHAWGTANPETSNVALHRERGAGAQDLLELAVLHTLWRGGDVTVLPRDRMPEPSPVAAVMRRGAAVMGRPG